MTEYEKVKLLDCDLQKIVLAGPLSRNTIFALYVTGPWTDKEAENLIKQLELQKTWLVRDEKENGE